MTAPSIQPFWRLLRGIRGAVRGWSDIKRIDVVEASHLMRSREALLIDIRPASEWQKGLAVSAVPAHWREAGFTSTVKDIANNDLHQPIVLICRTGGSSMIAARKLYCAGFSHIHAVEGGMHDWRVHKLPMKGLKR